jgi:hypothetical protein
MRVDMTETVFYSSAKHTKNGKLTGSFYLSDLITKFRIITDSFDTKGRIGYL